MSRIILAALLFAGCTQEHEMTNQEIVAEFKICFDGHLSPHLMGSLFGSGIVRVVCEP